MSRWDNIISSNSGACRTVDAADRDIGASLVAMAVESCLDLRFVDVLLVELMRRRAALILLFNC
jgi:hypothetical protein